MNIIKLAFAMAEAVQHFYVRAKRFYGQVVLLGYRCGRCNGQLTMIAESNCRCNKCRQEFDPTVQFQRCSNCGGVPVRKVSRHQCRNCGKDIHSRFVFENRVFDAEYFRQKVAESRRRKQEQHEQIRQMLAASRSPAAAFEPVDLNSVPGLIQALNGLTGDIDEKLLLELKSKFDLQRYQDHICQYVGAEPVNLREIPALMDNARLDLIWRFVAVIFLEHEREVDTQQQGQAVWVVKHADRQGQDIFGEIEDIDGLGGLAG